MRAVHYMIEAPLMYNLFSEDRLTQQYLEYDSFHCHKGLEILYVHQGSGRVVIDGEILPLCDNMLILFQPFQLHGVILEKAVTYCRSVVVFEWSELEPYLLPFPKLAQFVKELFTQTLKNQVLYGPTKMIYEACLARKKNAREYTGEIGESEALFLMGVLAGILTEGDRFSSETGSRAVYDETLSKVLEYIECHYMSPYSAEAMGAALGISKYYLIHMFKSKLGVTISGYITQRRIREAKYRLASSEMPIELLSDALGFSSSSHFCRTFKRYTGTTPHSYRKQFFL